MQDGKHEQGGENELQDETLRSGTSRQCSAQAEVRGKKDFQNQTGAQGTTELRREITRNFSPRKTSCRGESQRDRWIQMRTRNSSVGKDHRHNDEAEGQCNPDMRDRPSTNVIDDDGTSASKDESEGAEEFGETRLHVAENN